MKKMLILTIGLSLISLSSFAATVAKKRYMAQGCGLGSMIFTEDTLMHNVLGGTTNGTSGNQTFGMSSGTLGCEVGPTKKTADIQVYIEGNKVALSNDIARGNGETLAGLSHLYNCEMGKMGPALQQNYGKIFNSESVSAEDINNNISSVLKENKACI